MGLEVKIYDTPAGGIRASQGTILVVSKMKKRRHNKILQTQFNMTRKKWKGLQSLFASSSFCMSVDHMLSSFFFKAFLHVHFSVVKDKNVDSDFTFISSTYRI